MNKYDKLRGEQSLQRGSEPSEKQGELLIK